MPAVPYRPLADFRPRERLAAVPHTTRRFACRSVLALSPHARALAFVSDQGSGKFEAWTAGGGERILLAAPAGHVVGGWSPQGDALLVMRVLDNTSQDLLVVDVASGSAREVTRHRDDTQHVGAGWLADGRVLEITDEESEHLYLAALDPWSGARERIDAPEWDIELAASSADGRVQIRSVNADG